MTHRLATLTPLPAIADADYCRNVTGTNTVRTNAKRASVCQLMQDIADFHERKRLAIVVVINLASTEGVADLAAPELASLAAFERALDENAPVISPAMLYAYAALSANCPHGNFTPSAAAAAAAVPVPALLVLAERQGLPEAGHDGKTGQTFVKTVLAPASRDRALRVDGWYSTNILGNRDGQALEDPGSLQLKLDTKGDVLNSILGYEVKDHIVSIQYDRPRGDDKETWDNIDVCGFLGHKMQIKVNVLCRDWVLAAPLFIDIARCLDLAHQRGEAGPLDALNLCFKAPLPNGGEPCHAFFDQQRAFDAWLDRAVRPTRELTPTE